MAVNRQSKNGVTIPSLEEIGNISKSVPISITDAKPIIIVREDEKNLFFNIL